MALKYVKTSKKEIIVFPESLGHDDFQYLHPVSAGFINMHYSPKQDKIVFACYGESKSLGLKSHEEDSRYAQIQLGEEW